MGKEIRYVSVQSDVHMHTYKWFKGSCEGAKNSAHLIPVPLKIVIL
jgi:hypothetical protein